MSSKHHTIRPPETGAGVDYRGCEGGFTLLELMVVMVIGAIAIAVMVPMFSSMTGADLKETTRQMAGVIRNTYDEAFLKNRPMRIVWNLDRNAYWLEIGSTEARIFRTESEREDYMRFLEDNERVKERLAEDKKREEDRRRSNVGSVSIEGVEADSNALADLFSGMFSKGKHSAVHPAEYQGVNGFQAVPDVPVIELPKGIRFAGFHSYAFDNVVRPSYEPPDTKEDEMVVSTTFFPSGYVEDSVIYVTDDKKTWSVLVNPLTGKVSITGEEVELPTYDERVFDE